METPAPPKLPEANIPFDSSNRSAQTHWLIGLAVIASFAGVAALVFLVLWLRAAAPLPPRTEPNPAVSQSPPASPIQAQAGLQDGAAATANSSSVIPSAAPAGALTKPPMGTSVGWIQLGKEVKASGLEISNQNHDGATEPGEIGGLECHTLQRYPGTPELYAYFRINPELKTQLTNRVVVELEYFDSESGGHFRLDYDSYEETSRAQGAYTQSKERVNFRGTGRWLSPCRPLPGTGPRSSA